MLGEDGARSEGIRAGTGLDGGAFDAAGRSGGRDRPEGRDVTVDHINRDPSDNRLENLRLATRSMQNLNRRMRKCCDLPRGVHSVRRAISRPYIATTRMGGKKRTLGYYATVEEASAAYEAELARQIEIEEARVQEILNVH